MNVRMLPRIGTALVLLIALTGAPTAASAETTWTPRAEDYTSVVKQENVPVPVSDGISLLADVTRPAEADGTPVATPLPVVVTITAYNKTALGSVAGATLGGADPAYLIKRGYIQVTVDARGTGSSPGVWQIFGEREQLDAKEIVEWAADQPWSNGSVAMTGPSYMGISQLFAAGQNPRGLKAIFPQVPSAEVYRDIVASGGQLDVGFIPLWLGLVNVTGVIPGPPEQALQTMLTHFLGGGVESLSLMLEALAGGERAHDGPYYRERSTLSRSVPNIDVPTFLIGGHYDLFQRGTPLVFQALHDRGVPVKMILGPWDHLQGSSGGEVTGAGYGTLSELQLRWFDHHVKGLPDPTLDADIADFTYYELGSGTWTQRDAYLAEQRARVFKLSGTSAPLTGGGVLTDGAVTDGASQIFPIPVAGLCTRSASQWTAGVIGLLPVPNPCDTDNSLNDRAGVVFETAPMAEDLQILGPIGARLYTSSTTGDGMLSVHVSRVGPDGKVERLTGGWQTISLNALDESRSLTIDGEIVQPWHPFTAESKRTLGSGEVAPIDVEVFPTGAVIPEGHKLRIAVQSFDVPHLLPPLTALPGTLGVLTIHNSAEYPSRVVLPALGPASGVDNGQIVDEIRDALGGEIGGGGNIVTLPERIAERALDAVLPGTGAPPFALLWLIAGVGLICTGGVMVARRFAPATAADIVREGLTRD